MKTLPKLALTLALAAAPIGIALAANEHAAYHGADSTQASTTAAASDAVSEGEVKKVDKETGKMTIKHGPLKNLDMPGMTMVFRVKDAAMLDQVKPGYKIRFVADKVAGAFTVLQLENVQ